MPQNRLPPRAIDWTAETVPFARPDDPRTTLTRAIAVETPVNLVYGGVPYAVMMTSPGDLEDFAYGFSLTEGVISRASDIRGVEVRVETDGIVIAIDISSERMKQHLARKRSMSGRTGCGVCGIEDMSQLPSSERVEGAGEAISTRAVSRALDALHGMQDLNRATRAVHAAGYATAEGEVLFVREDVGRHNALDKLVGAVLREGIDARRGFFVITSRCSFEMVEKVAALGGRRLVAISAPTSLAIERARHYGISLIGIARDDSGLAFTGDASKDFPPTQKLSIPGEAS